MSSPLRRVRIGFIGAGVLDLQVLAPDPGSEGRPLAEDPDVGAE